MNSSNLLKSTEIIEFFGFSEFFEVSETPEIPETPEVMNLGLASKNPDTSITMSAVMSIESLTTPTAPNINMIEDKNDSIDQIINRSIDQSIDQLANQSINQLIDQSAN